MTARKRLRGQNVGDQQPEVKAAFLLAYARGGIVGEACQKVGISRTTVYAWREGDEQFAARFEQGRLEADDVVRAEIHRRAIEGVEEPVYRNGVAVVTAQGTPITVRKYSDVLLIFLAKSRMPEFRDRIEIEHSIVEREAKRLADEFGLDPAEVLREAEATVKRAT